MCVNMKKCTGHPMWCRCPDCKERDRLTARGGMLLELMLQAKRNDEPYALASLSLQLDRVNKERSQYE